MDLITLPDLRSPGAVIDRLSILLLKVSRSDRHISQIELDSLTASWEQAKLPEPDTIAGYRQVTIITSKLWDLENEVRECEQRQTFGTHFFSAMDRIISLNQQRAELRDHLTTQIRLHHGVTLIEVESGLDAYADRIALALVAAKHRPRVGPDAAQALRTLWVDHGLPNIFDGELFHRLLLTHNRMWRIWDSLKAGPSESGPDRTFGPVCRSLYIVNDARSRTKKQIAIDNGSAFWDVKSYTPYDIPASWDQISLTWRP